MSVRQHTRISAVRAKELHDSARAAKATKRKSKVVEVEIDDDPEIPYHQRIHEHHVEMTVNSNVTVDRLNPQDFEDVVTAMCDDLPTMWVTDEAKNAYYGVLPELVNVKVEKAFEVGDKMHRLHAHLKVSFLYYGYGRMDWSAPREWCKSLVASAEQAGTADEQLRMLLGFNFRFKLVNGDKKQMREIWYQTKTATAERIRQQKAQGIYPVPQGEGIIN